MTDRPDSRPMTGRIPNRDSQEYLDGLRLGKESATENPPTSELMGKVARVLATLPESDRRDDRDSA